MTTGVFWLSFTTSAIASVVILLSQYVFSLTKDFAKYKKYIGKYDCYSYGSSDIYDGGYNTIQKNNSSACITYRFFGNKFSVEITDNNGQAWYGDINIMSGNNGNLSWSYNDPIDTKVRRIGSKEVSFWSGPEETRIYLKERFDKKYGRELLIKKVEEK